jgi:general secretion pathway protein A
MFRKHWGLRESPFRGSLDWRSFFSSPTHDEALARLTFLVQERRRLGLLFGSSGCGKSLVLEVFSRQLRRSGTQVSNVSLTGTDLHEFLWLVAADLGINPDRRDDVFRLWRLLLDRLVENRYQQLNTVVLLDDAEDASPQLLEHLVRLAQADCGTNTGLTIVLASDANFASQIPPRLLELAELRIDLEPWEPADTIQYVGTTLEYAGRREPLFTDEALNRLHDLSDGIPRRVNQLANLALVAGAGRKLDEIDAETVNDAYQELTIVQAVA